MFRRCLLLLAALAGLAPAVPAAHDLRIYFIDVEGGQSTLIVTPGGRSLLVDAGFRGNTFNDKVNRGRDASRVLEAIRDAGLKRIDYLLITHFHEDHDGGVEDVAAQIPIDTFIDHGTVLPAAEENVPGTLEAFKVYTAVRARARRHIEARPGDRIALKGVDLTIVSSGGGTIGKPQKAAGDRNAGCPAAPLPAQEIHDNPRSTGFLMRFGKFTFLDLGDLSGKPLFDLVCPDNLLGQIDVYLVAHHGGADAAAPATLLALRPRLALLNNGETKGGAAATFKMLHDYPIADVWQLHRSSNAGADNFPASQIANLDESTSHWLTLAARDDGSFRVTNGRTGDSKEFPRAR
jgi:competence protein ComEC